MLTGISRRSFLQLSTAALASRLWAQTHSELSQTQCQKLAADPLRPQYHLLPAHNWMNDPNGPIYYRGRYHMFHQYNPQGALWGNMNWAHATSPDMIHWQHEPIALAPTPGGPDQEGVFSGSAILDNGTPTLIYTGVAAPTASDATLRDGQHTWRETQCLAVAQDDKLQSWKKLAQPVIAAPPPGLSVLGFRDPCLWREGDEWMLILGSGTRETGGMALLYTSRDLRHWTYLHPLVQGTPSRKETTNPVDTGDMWECPDFFPLAGKHVLLISTMGKVRWKVGTYRDRRFTAEKEGVADWGSYYAAKTMVDRDGNRVLWGWITENRPDAELLKAGWAGAMSLPRVLSLNSNQDLQIDVAPCVKTLRTPHSAQTSPGQFRMTDLCGELAIELLATTGALDFRLESDNGVFASFVSSKSETGWQLRVNNYSAPIPVGPNPTLRLHMLVDGSVVEVFVNDTVALTARLYQIPSGPLRLRLGPETKIKKFEAWQLAPITHHRLTASECRL